MKQANTYTGPWMDSFNAAIDSAMSDVNISRAEYIECKYAEEGSKFVPLDESRSTILAFPQYSQSRDQYRARLIKIPTFSEEIS